MPLTEVVSQATDAHLLGLVHADDGVLNGVLELATRLVSPVHQLECPTKPFTSQSSQLTYKCLNVFAF